MCDGVEYADVYYKKYMNESEKSGGQITEIQIQSAIIRGERKAAYQKENDQNLI